MALHTLFVTRVHDAPLLAEPGLSPTMQTLAQACRQLAEDDLAGQAWSRSHGYRGYTSYGSLTDLPLRMPEFAELKRRLDRHAASFAAELNFALPRRLRLDSLWVNILKPGGHHSGHIHPHAVLSGTVYIELPQATTRLKLEDPRLPMMMARPAVRTDAPVAEQAFVYLTPAVGSVLIWESWLRHEVPPNTGRIERISISFNYA